jgi:hypothetical protein
LVEVVDLEPLLHRPPVCLEPQLPPRAADSVPPVVGDLVRPRVLAVNNSNNNRRSLVVDNNSSDRDLAHNLPLVRLRPPALAPLRRRGRLALPRAVVLAAVPLRRHLAERRRCLAVAIERADLELRRLRPLLVHLPLLGHRLRPLLALPPPPRPCLEEPHPLRPLAPLRPRHCLAERLPAQRLVGQAPLVLPPQPPVAACLAGRRRKLRLVVGRPRCLALQRRPHRRTLVLVLAVPHRRPVPACLERRALRRRPLAGAAPAALVQPVHPAAQNTYPFKSRPNKMVGTILSFIPSPP